MKNDIFFYISVIFVLCSFAFFGYIKGSSDGAFWILENCTLINNSWACGIEQKI